ncbi:VIT1/CCC1 transporter family protein, partial [Roseivivax sp. CAU 1761]
LRDAVFGAVDGAVTTFAIVAGAAGAGLATHIVVVIGIVSVLADGISMAAADWLGVRTDADDKLHRGRGSRAGNTQAVRRTLLEAGVPPERLETCLHRVATDLGATQAVTLKSAVHPGRAALTTFLAFVTAGMMPLWPFILNLPRPFATSAFATAAAFVIIGYLRGVWTSRKSLHTMVETTLIGGGAAIVAYAAGIVLSG